MNPGKQANVKKPAVKADTAETNTTSLFINFILDRSGSMEKVREDTIGGFNTFLREQQKQPGTCQFGMTLFNQDVSATQYGDIQALNRLSHDTYQPGGNTALFDAVGQVITRVQDRETESRKNGTPLGYNKVLVVILTDGQENASKEYNSGHIKDLIASKEKDGWEFVYIGMAADAWQAQSIGIKNIGAYTASAAGTASVYSNVSNTVSAMRATGQSASSFSKSDWSSDTNDTLDPTNAPTNTTSTKQ